jgi:PHB/PHA accumulation regulator DNA-binding domain
VRGCRTHRGPKDSAARISAKVKHVPDQDETGVTLKRYAGKRLYDPKQGRYLAPEEVAALLRAGTAAIITDAMTGADVTQSVLAKIGPDSAWVTVISEFCAGKLLNTDHTPAVPQIARHCPHSRSPCAAQSRTPNTRLPWYSLPAHSNVPGMTEKTPPAGWVVQISTFAKPEQPVPGSPWRGVGGGLLGAPSFKYFNVAIGVAAKAIEATEKQLTGPDQGEASVVRALSSGEIAALALAPGQVKPA